MPEVQKAAGDGWEVRQIKQLLPGGVKNTCEVQSTRVNKADAFASRAFATSFLSMPRMASGSIFDRLRLRFGSGSWPWIWGQGSVLSRRFGRRA